jgi:hypothetical protein
MFRKIAEESEDLTEIEQARDGLRLVDVYEKRDRKILEINKLIQRDREKDLEVQEKLQHFKGSRIHLDDDAINNRNSDPYLARGWVSGIGRYAGRPGTHRLMKAGRVLYYLEAEEGTGILLGTFLNKRVGIKGIRKELDPKHGADLILVSDLDVLSDR